MKKMKIEENKFVSLVYKLKLGKNQEVVEEATKDNPLEFIFGTNSMLPGLEAKLAGLNKGESFEFILESDDAYGAYEAEYVVDLPMDIFMDGEGKLNTEVVAVGNVVPMMDTNGNKMQGTILEIGESQIKVDFNHEYAGKDLGFAGDVLEVRDATPEELTALFASDGCGCGSSCGCGSGEEEEEEGCGSGCGCGSGGCH